MDNNVIGKQCSSLALSCSLLMAGYNVRSAVLELVQGKLPVTVHGEDVSCPSRKIHPQGQPIQKCLQGTNVPSWFKPAKYNLSENQNTIFAHREHLIHRPKSRPRRVDTPPASKKGTSVSAASCTRQGSSYETRLSTGTSFGSLPELDTRKIWIAIFIERDSSGSPVTEVVVSRGRRLVSALRPVLRLLRRRHAGTGGSTLPPEAGHAASTPTFVRQKTATDRLLRRSTFHFHILLFLFVFLLFLFGLLLLLLLIAASASTRHRRSRRRRRDCRCGIGVGTGGVDRDRRCRRSNAARCSYCYY